jgi:hypothetical protein
VESEQGQRRHQEEARPFTFQGGGEKGVRGGGKDLGGGAKDLESGEKGLGSGENDSGGVEKDLESGEKDFESGKEDLGRGEKDFNSGGKDIWGSEKVLAGGEAGFVGGGHDVPFSGRRSSGIAPEMVVAMMKLAQGGGLTLSPLEKATMKQEGGGGGASDRVGRGCVDTKRIGLDLRQHRKGEEKDGEERKVGF